MPWPIEYTNEFGDWWDDLTEAQQDRLAATVRLLTARGPLLPFPFSAGVAASRHPHMRELRVQSRAIRYGSSTPLTRGVLRSS
jgi:hypothetical protein